MIVRVFHGDTTRLNLLIGALVVCSATALAQTSVPVIRFDSIPELLKLPENL